MSPPGTCPGSAPSGQNRANSAISAPGGGSEILVTNHVIYMYIPVDFRDGLSLIHMMVLLNM